MATVIAQNAAQIYFYCVPLGKMIYQKWKKNTKRKPKKDWKQFEYLSREK